MTKFRDAEPNNEEVEPEVEPVKGTSNTRLPFGLCMKFGIAIGENWTPRDAWNALKGKGVYPPWTDEGENQYDGVGNDDVIENTGDGDAKIHLEKKRKELYTNIHNKLGQFGDEFKKDAEKVLMDLDDSEINMLNKFLDQLRIQDGAGYQQGNKISVNKDSKSPLDKELGYQRAMCTFMHELGHFVDHKFADYIDAHGTFNKTGKMFSVSYFSAVGYASSRGEEVNKCFKDDMNHLLNMVSERTNTPLILNFNRLSRDQKSAIRHFCEDYSDANKLPEYKSEYDFIKREPIERYYFTGEYYEPGTREYEDRVNLLRRWGYKEDEAKARIEKTNQQYITENVGQKEKYEKDLKEYKEYLETPQYQADVKAYTEYNVNREKIRRVVDVKKERSGFLNDFIATYTNGRVNPAREGIGGWGHSTSYCKDQAPGVELWAEYFSAKMTRDKVTLDMMKECLPSTIAYYERLYTEYGKEE